MFQTKTFLCLVFVYLSAGCGPGLLPDDTPASSGGGGGTSSCQSSSTTSKKIFQTTSQYDGNLGGVTGADSKCNSDAGKPAGGGTYKALIASGTTRRACTTLGCTGGCGEGSSWVLKPNTTYIQGFGTNQTIGTTTSAAIFAFPLSAVMGDQTSVSFTGLTKDWTNHSNNCTEWTNNTAGTGRVGDDTQTISDAISSGNTACTTTTVNLFCVEQ